MQRRPFGAPGDSLLLLGLSFPVHRRGRSSSEAPSRRGVVAEGQRSPLQLLPSHLGPPRAEGWRWGCLASFLEEAG